MMSAVVKRTVIDTLTLQVRASTDDHAFEMARRALEDYPMNLTRHYADIPMLCTEDRESIDSEIIDLEFTDDQQKDGTEDGRA